MTSYEVIVKHLDPIRVAVLSADLADHTEIGAAAGRLYPRLHAALGRNRVDFSGVSYALYEDTGHPDLPIRLAVGLPVPDDTMIDEDGIATIDVPAVGRAATTVVKGPPSLFADAFGAIHDWIERTGERSTHFEREVYLDCDGPQDTWVTELQKILDPAPAFR